MPVEHLDPSAVAGRTLGAGLFGQARGRDGSLRPGAGRGAPGCQAEQPSDAGGRWTQRQLCPSSRFPVPGADHLGGDRDCHHHRYWEEFWDRRCEFWVVLRQPVAQTVGMEYTSVARRKEGTMNRTHRIAHLLTPLALLTGIAVATPVAQAAPSGQHQAARMATLRSSPWAMLPCICIPVRPLCCLPL
jgi:hypothetical protein